jgi:nicotinamidase/pyrazinamidase
VGVAVDTGGTPSFDQRTALVVVDVQNDFTDPGGSLYVRGGEEIVPLVNGHVRAARAAGATVVLTQDWHPPRTPHFVADGGTWPVHCVKGTWGAELYPGLDADADAVVRKGTGGEDGYSAFHVSDPQDGTVASTGLAGYLRDRGVESVVVVGLAADVCVRATAEDAASEGFAVTVPWDATRPVELQPGDGDRARDALRAAGVAVLDRAG